MGGTASTSGLPALKSALLLVLLLLSRTVTSRTVRPYLGYSMPLSPSPAPVYSSNPDLPGAIAPSSLSPYVLVNILRPSAPPPRPRAPSPVSPATPAKAPTPVRPLSPVQPEEPTIPPLPATLLSDTTTTLLPSQRPSAPPGSPSLAWAREPSALAPPPSPPPSPSAPFPPVPCLPPSPEPPAPPVSPLPPSPACPELLSLPALQRCLTAGGCSCEGKCSSGGQVRAARVTSSPWRRKREAGLDVYRVAGDGVRVCSFNSTAHNLPRVASSADA